MKQQTAVEWLEFMVKGMIENGGDLMDLLDVMDHIQEAKQMEKKQIMNAYDCALFGHGVNGAPCASGGKYYNETYGKE